MAAKKKKTDSSDDSDTPEKELTEQILPEGGLVDAVVAQSGISDEPLEEQIVEQDSKLIDSILSSYLGDEMLEQLKEHAVIKDFETIDDANNALVFGGSTRNEIKFLQFRDEKIKQTLKQKMERLRDGPKDDKTRAQQAARLANIRRINQSLTTVFGFDDPRQAEAFIAAWLMEDSTCRLSGIPGTGKTTAVESAGLLLANSYGFDAESRFIPKKPSDPDSTFFQFIKGQEYDAYLNNNADGIRVDWDKWRFSEWYVYYEDPVPPHKMIKINSQLSPDKKNRGEVSGSYLFDDTFLQQTYKIPMTTGGITNAPKLGSMKPAEFRRALLNVWIWKEEKTSLLDDSTYYEYHLLPINLGLEAFANGDGRIAEGQPHPNKKYAEIGGEDADGKKTGYKALYTVNYTRILGSGITVPDGSTLADEVTRLNLRTDAGRNEGYDLREWLMKHYYDSRVDKDADNPAGWTEIKGEMLREIGTAKIDYDKRADEVLYGMDIRQVSKPDPIEQSKVITAYEFEPIPRPVVTQPIKFFNEANRSQSGVEDAILGLIAEKEVEYRGRSFRSPNFVAWMDTNPHQKGNDLAFVDRIDMELMFSTLTLGQKYIQLNAQYNPQSISTKSMVKEAISQPQDRIIFDPDIGIASDSLQKAQSLRVADLTRLWKHINKIPFDNTGGDVNNYNGLRDIALLSVIFTQRFMSKPTVNELGGQTRTLNLPDARKIHSSPLIDISKASNEALLEGGTAASGIAGFETNATAFGDPITDDMRTQTPTIFTRVLGFRFQKSLVKLSRAFAFLRGKDFVTRTEILDALPYVVGHRMGPARAGGDSAGGRDVGFVDGAMGALTSEQEMVKELVVAGYIKSSTSEDQGAGVWDPLSSEDANPNPMDRKNTLLDVWDSYYQKCISVLKSSGNFTEYESKVLHPLKLAINGMGNNTISLTTTPIHWHIAAMVVEQEKKADDVGVMALRKDDGMTYSERYNNYFKAMNAPTRNMNPLVEYADVPSTAEEIGLDYSLYDYYYLRGKIANDPLLFTDDRTYLLGLVESRIQAFVGPSFNLNPGETSNVTYARSSSPIWTSENDLVATDWNDEGYIVEPNPGVAINSTYNDALGGYGQLFGGSWSEPFTINSLMPHEESELEEMFVVENAYDFSYQMTNQKMRIDGIYQHEQDRNGDLVPITTTARSPQTYLAASDAVTEDFSAWTQGMAGVVIDPATQTISEDKLDFGVTMEDIELALESILLNPTMTTEKAIQKVIPVSNWIQDVFTPNGAIFCFELRHHSSSRGANSLLLLMKQKELLEADATEIPGDKLRLWVWIAADIDSDPEGESSKTVSLVTTYGITSDFLENTIFEGNTIDQPGNFVSIDNEAFYGSGDNAEVTYVDAGNITEADVSAYNMLFREAVRRSTQGA